MRKVSQNINTVRLKSGFDMPVLGMGTWRLTGNECEESVRKALKLGYRHIDTAELYGNESEIGRAIKGYDREDLFITSKAWVTNLDRDGMLSACTESLRKLGTSYLDLYLLHWPSRDIPIAETIVALGELVDRGMVRSIGLSNFSNDEAKEAISLSDKPVSVNQVEFHPHLFQEDILRFCRKEGIALTAYCPLARGSVLGDTVLASIAEEYDKSPAQISLRWLVQHGAVVIPKSTNVEHLKEDMDIFGWKLSKEDMDRIDSIGIFERQVNPRFNRMPFFGTIGKIANRFMR